MTILDSLGFVAEFELYPLVTIDVVQHLLYIRCRLAILASGRNGREVLQRRLLAERIELWLVLGKTM